MRKLLIAHNGKLRPAPGTDRDMALSAVAEYLARAQDQGSDDGLGSFHLVHGWSASYPETTGYLIPTLLELADHLQRPDLQDRAKRAADWLLDIQIGEGGWQGGRVNEQRPAVVFNTAQVVRGLIAIHAMTKEQPYLDAAVRACDWMVASQEDDGSWNRHNFLGRSRVYDSYVSAPLLHMHKITGGNRYHSAAIKNLEWVLSRQQPNGWFADADNTVKHNDRPITHTIAYTLDGLVESFTHTRDSRYLDAAIKAADVLLKKFMAHGLLNGRYDANWHGSEMPLCTGNAQLAIVWARLHALTGRQDMLDGSKRMGDWLVAVQQLTSPGPLPAHGAVTGSFPLWGRYEKFAFPNWAQKYFADALLCNEGRLPRF